MRAESCICLQPKSFGLFPLQVDGASVRLHLPKLRHLRIGGFSLTRAKLRLDRDSFSEAPRLEVLSLVGPGAVMLMPDCFAGLTALATLTLHRCGLSAIPTAVTALANSLTSLMLPFNDGLQLADDDITVLLALSKLQTLDLRKQSLLSLPDNPTAVAVSAHLHYVPAPWSECSLKRLVRLPSAFIAKHGRAIALEVHVEPETDQLSDEDEDEGDDG